MRKLDFSDYADKLGDSARETLVVAIEESHKRDLNYLTISHVLLALFHTQKSFFSEVIQNEETIRTIIEKLDAESDYLPNNKDPKVQFTLKIKDLFRQSWISSVKNRRKRIEGIDFINALFQMENGPLSSLLQKFHISPERTSAILTQHLNKSSVVMLEGPHLTVTPKWPRLMRAVAFLVLLIILVMFVVFLLAA